MPISLKLKFACQEDCEIYSEKRSTGTVYAAKASLRVRNFSLYLCILKTGINSPWILNELQPNGRGRPNHVMTSD